MARETRAGAGIHELMEAAGNNQRNGTTGAKPMTSTQYTTNMARALMAAEMIMAAVNCGASIGARGRAEEVLDDYFALVEQAVSRTEHNPLDRRS
jgi:hypothetical protein